MMKKVACAICILAMIIFLINPLFSNAGGPPPGPPPGGGGHWGGGHWGGGYGWWWVPWALILGIVALSSHDNAPAVIQEQPPVYFRPAPLELPSTDEKLYIYPSKGQSEELQAKDRYECHSWARNQTYYDPTQPPGGMPENQLNQLRAGYQRALCACLEGRGYTVR